MSGNLTECGCDARGQGKSTPEGWKWGGCRLVWRPCTVRKYLMRREIFQRQPEVRRQLCQEVYRWSRQETAEENGRTKKFDESPQ